jgi:flagellar biosynthesis chaperone FliJ
MALSFAKANQLPLYIEKNEFLNALIGKSVEDYHRELSKARRGVVETKKKILHLYNDQNE